MRFRTELAINQQKVGVLTLHRCINYGSYWQARCLVDGLRARGLDAVILNHDSQRVNRAEWRHALRPAPASPQAGADQGLYRQKMERFFEAFAALSLSCPFRLEQPGDLKDFDQVVVGSDEVWNLMHPWYSSVPLFYGDGVEARRLIAYAASCGNYPGVWGLESVWAERLRRFDRISVRDPNTRLLIKTTLGWEPPLVLDPCLQFPPQPEGPWRGPNYPFVAVYGTDFSTRFQNDVRRWAEERGLPLISIGYRNPWAGEQWIEAGPHDFAHCMARAEAVATNFFHGCVFALRNRKPFVCEVSAYRSLKVQGLMETVGGSQHLIGDDTLPAACDKALDAPLAPALLERVDALRQASNGYLDGALI